MRLFLQKTRQHQAPARVVYSHIEKKNELECQIVLLFPCTFSWCLPFAVVLFFLSFDYALDGESMRYNNAKVSSEITCVRVCVCVYRVSSTAGHRPTSPLPTTVL